MHNWCILSHLFLYFSEPFVLVEKDKFHMKYLATEQR